MISSYDDEVEDDEDEQTAGEILLETPPPSEAERWRRAVDAQADALVRACDENDSLRAEVEDLAYRLTEAEIARDEAREALVNLTRR